MRRPWILVVLALLLLVAVLFLLWALSSPSSSSSLSASSLPLLLEPCTASCSGDLVCSRGLCRLPVGSPCSSAALCTDFCSGVCVSGPSGSLGQFCPCGPGLLCGERSGAPCPPGTSCDICLAGPGAPCSGDSDCATGVCSSGSCLSGLPPGRPCAGDSSCAGGNCSSGFCQAPGATTGAPGASCSSAVPCSPGLSCADGTCREGTAGLGESCSSSLVCTAQFACLSPSPTGTCLALPSCSPTECQGGFSCSSGLCLAGSGLGVVLAGSCLSGSCSPPGTIVRLTYAPGPDGDLLGATDLAWETVTRVPSALSAPTRLFADSSTGTLFLLQPGLPLFSFRGTWLSSSPPGSLLDADVDPTGTFFLLASLVGGSATLYRYANSSLSPYRGGVQFTSSGPLSFSSLSVNRSGLPLLFSSGTAYLPSSSGLYSPVAGGLSSASLYSSSPSDLATVSSSSQVVGGCRVGRPVVFSGSLGGLYAPSDRSFASRGTVCAGAAQPVAYSVSAYSFYSPSPDPSLGTLLAVAQSSVDPAPALYVVGNSYQFLLPVPVGAGSLPLVTADGIYLYQPCTCS